MKFAFSDIDLGRAGTLVVGIGPDRALGASAAAVNEICGGALARALVATKVTGKLGEIAELLAPAGLAAARVLMVGMGAPQDLSIGKLEGLGGGVMAQLLDQREAEAAFALDPVAPALDAAGLSTAAAAAAIAHGARLRAYRFDRYRTKERPEDKPALQTLTLMSAESGAAAERFAGLDKLADGVYFARDLVAEPANVLNPAAYAERLKPLAALGLEIEILGPTELRALGMGSLLGVAQGSIEEPRLAVMRWNGGTSGAAPLALIGKGVTFDSGGLSLKTAKGMEDMKWDMAGSAAVVGAMIALAGRHARANVVGVIALVENMPSATAQRPGDIVKSMSGQTIEVLNTDAEGRLILADALWYAQDRFKPSAMIDLATLTGAIITALGHEHVGMFASDDALADAISAAGKVTGETVWRMPLGDAYDRLLRSDIADMKNIGDGTAGSIVGAQFLRRFTNDIPWAHLDIAGVAWGAKDQPTTPKGATGWGVRLLDRLVRDKYEG